MSSFDRNAGFTKLEVDAVKYKSISSRASRRDKTLDPLEVFANSIQRGTIEQLRGPQQEALEQWHSNHRAVTDLLLSLDTGGGKSLVGLLMAQSLLNEVQRPLLYLCPTIQLIAQIHGQAADIGLEIDTYFKGSHTNETAFNQARVPCVTTYHAAFNGLSHFRGTRLGAVILDDSHVSESIIRSCFSLTWSHGESEFECLAQIFAEYFDRTPYASDFKRRAVGDSSPTDPPLLVPFHVLQRRTDAVSAVLQSASDDKNRKYAWPHLRDHVPQLLCFFGRGRVELTPWRLPIEQSPVFGQDVRRIYLSATLPSRVAFARTFGRMPSAVIEPKGKTNAAQRVFAFPGNGKMKEAVDEATSGFGDSPRVILVPSHFHADKWTDTGTVLPQGEGTAELEDFRAKRTNCLILVGRYDGIDFPGEQCQLLVVDGLPRGEHLIDGYFASVLGLVAERTIRVADRLVQGFGRIFRSNRDHGMVFIADPGVAAWLQQPDNYRHLPALLQKQLLLSQDLYDSMTEHGGDTVWPSVFNDVVGGDPEWDEFYKNRIASIDAEASEETTEELEALEEKQSRIFSDLWLGRNMEAQSAAEGLVKNSSDLLPIGHRAWLWSIAASAALLDERKPEASGLAENARRLVSQFGRFEDVKAKTLRGDLAPTGQARNVVSRGLNSIPDDCALAIEQILSDKDDDSKTHHRGLILLGRLLGLGSEDADKGTGGAGPDVFWRSPQGGRGLVLEAKLNKKSNATYGKRDFVQIAAHAAWAEKQVGQEYRLFIVGPTRTVEKSATPPLDVMIVEASAFVDIAERLSCGIEEVNTMNTGDKSAAFVQELLDREGLLFEQIMDGSLRGTPAVDLQA